MNPWRTNVGSLARRSTGGPRPALVRAGAVGAVSSLIHRLSARRVQPVLANLGLLFLVAALLAGPGAASAGCLPAGASEGMRDGLPPGVDRGVITADRAAGLESAARAAYARLPFYFVENRGQVDREVAYYARQGGASLYFTPGEVVMDLPGSVLRQRFLGANPAVRITGAEEQAARFSYFLGSEPDGWRSDVPSYGQVVYHDLYPGVDLRYLGRDGALKYEFVLQPGAEPAAIRLAYAGAEGLRLAGNGDLLVVPQGAAGEGALRDAAPYAYQEIGGARVVVEAAFTLYGEQAYGFVLGAYDPGYPLVIDPELSYSTYLGGSDQDSARAIALDGAGYVYVTGTTASDDLPTTAGAYDTSRNGNYDAFVSVLDPTLGSLLHSTLLGGGNYESSIAIALDGAGNVYVTGITESGNFPTTAGAYDTSYGGGWDIFLSVLDPTLGSLLSSTFLGEGGSDYGTAIALDGAGKIYVAGHTRSNSFPTTAGAYDTSYNGIQDAFVSVLDPTLGSLLSSTFLGGSGDDYGNAIALDGGSNVYVTGYTESGDLPTTAGAFDTSHNDGWDIFVSVLDPTLGSLLRSTFLGGSGSDYGRAIALDAVGKAYVTGYTESGNFPATTGAYDTSYYARRDVIVSVLDPTLASLLSSTFLGGSDHDEGWAIALDDTGNAYVTGITWSIDFPTTIWAHDRSHNGSMDVFVSVLDPTLGRLRASTYLGGSGEDQGLALTLDGAGKAYVTGITESGNFPTTAGAYDTSYGGSDVFVSVLEMGPWPAYVYVPLVLRYYFPDPYEPNNSFAQAWGPLASGQTYHAYFPTEADENDYYYFDLPVARSVEIWLTDILPGNDHALYLYDAAQALVDFSDEYDNADEHIFLASVPAGRYYVRVERFQGTTRTQPYVLRATFTD